MEIFEPFILKIITKYRSQWRTEKQNVSSWCFTVPSVLNLNTVVDIHIWTHTRRCLLHTSPCSAASLTSDPSSRVGPELMCCARSTWLKYSYRRAQAAKLLPYLSHILMLCPARGLKEARYSIWLCAEGGGGGQQQESGHSFLPDPSDLTDWLSVLWLMSHY